MTEPLLAADWVAQYDLQTGLSDGTLLASACLEQSHGGGGGGGDPKCVRARGY